MAPVGLEHPQRLPVEQPRQHRDAARRQMPARSRARARSAGRPGCWRGSGRRGRRARTAGVAVAVAQQRVRMRSADAVELGIVGGDPRPRPDRCRRRSPAPASSWPRRSPGCPSRSRGRARAGTGAGGRGGRSPAGRPGSWRARPSRRRARHRSRSGRRRRAAGSRAMRRRGRRTGRRLDRRQLLRRWPASQSVSATGATLTSIMASPARSASGARRAASASRPGSAPKQELDPPERAVGAVGLVLDLEHRDARAPSSSSALQEQPASPTAGPTKRLARAAAARLPCASGRTAQAGCDEAVDHLLAARPSRTRCRACCPRPPRTSP